jgi:hypothetical protein
MRILLTVITLLGVVHNNVSAQDSDAGIRTWSDITGQFQVQAELVRVTSDAVDLKTTNGVISVPLEKLDKVDQQYAMKGFQFGYQSDGGYDSAEELAKAYLAALKERSGQKILNMYVPQEVFLTGVSKSGGVNAEQLERARTSWRDEIYPENEHDDCQGQRTAHFLNGQFQKIMIEDGFDINKAEVTGVFPKNYITTNPFVDSKSRGPFGIFNCELRISFSDKPEVFEIDIPAFGFFEGKWYISRFGNVYYFSVDKVRPKSSRPVSEVLADISRLRKTDKTIRPYVSVRTPNGQFLSSLGQFDEDDEEVTFRDQLWDETSQRYTKQRLTLDRLPQGTQITSLTIGPSFSPAKQVGIEDATTILEVLSTNPSIDSLSIDNIELSPSFDLARIINSLPDDFRYLSLSGVKCSTSELGRALNSLPSKLKTLRIYKVANLEDYTFLSRLTELKSLTLWRLEGGDNLSTAIAGLKQLESLTLRKVTGISAAGMMAIVDSHKSGKSDITLKVLQLSVVDYAKVLPFLTYKEVEIGEDTFSLRDARSFRVAPRYPWEFRRLKVSSDAFKDLSDEDEAMTEEAFKLINSPRVSLYLSDF